MEWAVKSSHTDPREVVYIPAIIWAHEGAIAALVPLVTNHLMQSFALEFARNAVVYVLAFLSSLFPQNGGRPTHLYERGSGRPGMPGRYRRQKTALAYSLNTCGAPHVVLHEISSFFASA